MTTDVGIGTVLVKLKAYHADLRKTRESIVQAHGRQSCVGQQEEAKFGSEQNLETAAGTDEETHIFASTR